MKRGLRALFCAFLACGVPLTLLATTEVRAQASAKSEDAKLVLRIEGPLPEGVTQEQIRAAIAAELSVDVALEAPGVTGLGTIVVRIVENGAVVVFSTSDGRSVHREVAFPKSANVAEVIALLVGNLARDEAADIVEGLHVGVSVSVSASAPIASAAEKPARPLLVAEKPAAPPPALATPCNTSGPVIGGDVVPGVGSSTRADGRRAVRIASFNLIGGLTHGIAGFELSAGFNAETGFMCGVQIAGGANVVRGPVHGVQLAGGVNLGADVSGAQIAGGFNLARFVRGVQLAPLNIGRDIHGLQLGVLNVAGTVHGAQLGVVNVADESDAPIGVVSIVRHGTTHVSLFGTESGYFSLELLHGGRRVHNIFGLGIQPGYVSGRALPGLAYGLGIRAVDRESYTLDVDLLATSFVRVRSTASQTFEFFTVEPELRAVFSVPLGEQAALVFGPSVRMLVSSDPATRPQGSWSGIAVYDERRSTDPNSTVSHGTAGWLLPGAMLGLRL
ncbi:MAG: hypothetical protein ACXVEF_05610 [Polyangiales bacterium]